MNGDVATPLVFVVIVAERTPPANVPLGPLTGALNVTTPPATGSPEALVTVATSGALNRVVMVAL